MKKIIAVLVLAVMLFGTASIVLAQVGPNNCCKMNNNMTWQGDKYEGNAVVKCGGTGCTISKGQTVGDIGIACSRPSSGGALNVAPEFTTPDWGMICFVNTIDVMTNWVFYAMTAIAVLLFIYGGLTYMTALGDPDKAGKGKQIIIYAMIGLIIALVSKVVPAIVTTLVK